jgi:DNA-binding XRE family transcriptional regulator
MPGDPLNPKKRNKLQKLGYRVTDAQEYAGLSDQEMALIELKISLIQKLRAVRSRRALSQKQFAELLQLSRSRVAMLERGAPELSVDLICRALIAVGVPRRDIGKAISSRRAA